MTVNTPVYVVTFDPLPPHSIGGYDWYPDPDTANARYDELAGQNGEDPTHRIRLWEAVPPGAVTGDEVDTWVEGAYGDDTLANDAPLRDSHPMTDREALTLAVYALNTLLYPDSWTATEASEKLEA